MIELENVDQQAILSRIKCSTLIIWGDLDTSIALKELKDAINFLPKGSILNVVKGANHKFEGKVNELVKAIAMWITSKRK